ncbi:MAG: hypothetical protein HQ546_04785 [Planctomycetes bacterium]|nr:hypothetical protein [Planctomycetota bacterium]
MKQYKQQSPLSAIRLQPNYHRYDLADACVDELAEVLGDSDQSVLVIQMRMEDERSQYPLMKVRGVPVESVIALAQRCPELPIVCLSAYRPEANELVQRTDNVLVDIAFIEFLDTLTSVLKHIPSDRLLFGSHTPFLYTRASIMKIECASIGGDEKQAIGSRNAAAVFSVAQQQAGRV